MTVLCPDVDDTLHHGAYTIVRMVGRSGSAAVFAATQRSLDRLVAIKILRMASDQTTRHFLAQTRTNARLRHPNICQIIDAGVDSRFGPFAVAELLKGDDLEAVMRRAAGPVETNAAASYLRGIARAAGAAAAAGVVHGNLKSRNVHVELPAKGGVLIKVRDFGHGQGCQGLVGTPAYLSPEQFMGQPADSRSDVFSFGVVGYELVTGQKPFDGGRLVLQAQTRQEDHKEMFREVMARRGLPAVLVRLIDRCLTPARRDRPSWDDLQAALEAVRDQASHAAN